MIVQNRIAKLRDGFGMSRQELAESLKISDSFLCSLELQKANPSFGLALRICQELGESMERVLPYGNVDVGPSMRGYHGRREVGNVGNHLSPTPEAQVSDEVDHHEAGPATRRPSRAQALSDGELRGLEEARPEPCGVLNHERHRLQELTAYASERGYKEGYVYHRAREEGLLFAYEHVLGSQSTPGDAPYGPQRARHPEDPEPLLHPNPFPQRPAIFTLAGTVLTADTWRKMSRHARAGDAPGFRRQTRPGEVIGCVVCGGIGRQHATECHAEYRFSVGESGAGLQRLDEMHVLCPPCGRSRRIWRRQGFGKGSRAYESCVKHVEKVNRWTQERAYGEMASVLQRSRELSRIRWSLDSEGTFATLVSYFGPEYEIVTEARERLQL